jgi:hypothetical protein
MPSRLGGLLGSSELPEEMELHHLLLTVLSCEALARRVPSGL